MSSILIDTDVWGVVITLTAKTGGGTRAINAAFDYWAGGTIFSGNGTFYPLLASAPVVTRSCGQHVFIRNDSSVQLYAKTDFEEFGTSLADVLESYEINGAQVVIYYWAKPVDGLATHSEDVNRQMVGKVVGTSYDDISGILTLQIRDTAYEEIEVSREMTAVTLPGLVENADGQIGGIAFGEASASGSGLFLPAPLFDSQIVAGTPTAKAFTGWTFDDHEMQAASLYVRNPLRVKDEREWLPLTLTATPQSATYGAAGFTDLSGASYNTRYLTWYARGMTFTVASGGEVITHAKARLRHPNPLYYPATTFDGSSSVLYCPADSAHEITEDGITICGWFYFDALTSDRALVTKYGSATRRDYRLYYDSGANRFKFEVYDASGGSLGVATATTFGAPSTSTWYFITAKYDPAAGNEIRISVNDGTEDNANSSGTPGNSSAGMRIGAIRGGSYFDGRAAGVGFWDRPVSTSTVYDSGIGKVFESLTDTEREDLTAYYDLSDLTGNRVDSAGGNDLKANGTIGSLNGKISMPAITAEQGELTLRIYHAKLNTASDTYEPEGNVIREVRLETDDTDIETGSVVPYLQFDPPLVLEPAIYFAELDFSGRPGAPQSILCNFRSQVGETLYYRDKLTQNAGWSKSVDTQLDLSFYTLGEGAAGFVPSAGAGVAAHSYIALEAKEIENLVGSQTQLEFTNGLDFRALVEGLKDDGSGTYTGSAGALIEYPADIARFLLMHPSLVGLTSTWIDTASFDAVRASQAAAGIKHQFVIGSTAGVRELLVNLCREGKMRLYKKRNGKLALDYPLSTTTPDAILREGVMRADLMLLGVNDVSETDAANDWHQPFDQDYLGIPRELGFVREARTDKYFQLIEITPNGSTNSDTYRIAKCAASYALYGTKQHRDPFLFIDDPSVAQKLQNYFVDRWSTRQKRFSVRIPLSLGYSAYDLFSRICVSHTGLPSPQGTGFNVVAENANSEVTIYNEGIPVTLWAGGSLQGEVVEMILEGGFMTLTMETVSPFSNS